MSNKKSTKKVISARRESSVKNQRMDTGKIFEKGKRPPTAPPPRKR